MTTEDSNPSANQIFLACNQEYLIDVVKLCERITLQKKRALLIMHRHSSCNMFRDNPFYMLALELVVYFLDDIESAAVDIIRLFNPKDLPDIIIFDVFSIIWAIRESPVMQQYSANKLVRYIAKCLAAFSNYNEMVRETKQFKVSPSSAKVDTLIIMPNESDLLTPAHFQLLINLYFYKNEIHTNFTKIWTTFNVLQDCK